jgi:hypothetical protein
MRQATGSRMQYVIENTFDVSAKRYWEVFFSEDYAAGLFPHLEIDWKLLKFEKQGEGDDLVIIREAELTPHRQPPKVLQKLITTKIKYVESNVYTASKSEMTTKITPNFGADRVSNGGVYKVEPLGPDKCKRVWEGVCTCKIPLIGGRIEDYLVGEVKESYRGATTFTRKWLAEHPA